MPRSAISTGFIDYILPVARMGEQLVRYRDNLGKIELAPLHAEAEEAVDNHPSSASSGPFVADGQIAIPSPADTLYEILAQLRTRTGHNFASYKR